MTATDVNTERLFTGARIAVATSAARFVAISAVMAPLKSHFGLDNQQVGDGLVQAATNPLVVTIYPDRKTEMMNKLHLWFPASIVICGLIAFRRVAVLPIVLTIIFGLLCIGDRPH